MANPPKAAGTRWETELVDYLNVKELNAKRTGSEDHELGDFHYGLEREWTGEAKAEAAISIPEYLRQLDGEFGRRGTPPWKGAAFVKNRRHSVGDGYAVMQIRRYRQLVVYVQLLEMMVAGYAGVTPSMLLDIIALAPEGRILFDADEMVAPEPPADEVVYTTESGEPIEGAGKPSYDVDPAA